MSSFVHRVKFYLIGVFLGLILVFLFFGKNRCSYASYMPNGRVIAEVQTKKKIFTPACLSQLKQLHKDSIFVLDSVLLFGEINFKESEAQLKPCPKYKIYYKNYYTQFEKCSLEVNVYNFGIQPH